MTAVEGCGFSIPGIVVKWVAKPDEGWQRTDEFSADGEARIVGVEVDALATCPRHLKEWAEVNQN